MRILGPGLGLLLLFSSVAGARELTQDDIQFYMGLFTRLGKEIGRP